jgi:methyltransferase (TIGR00027 family)
MDTRAYWLECLKNVDAYLEVDEKALMDQKQAVCDGLGEKPLCNRVPISMDFSKETVKDLPKHGYDNSVPTFWLLEGLIMYLT